MTDGLALVQTVDFIGPVVDDPYVFGQIAAANSLSDVYAMGGRPLTAMNVFLFPCRELPREDAAAILAGGADKLREAGACLVGGHTVECPEVFYGLSVTGLVGPERLIRNGGARPGDVLVLTKPLGAGLVATAHKAGLATPDEVEAMTRSMATLNRAASEAMAEVGVNAATDVTGFGLAGHALGMAAQSGADFAFNMEALPFLPGAMEALANGLIAAGAYANRDQYRERIRIDCADAGDALLKICDPQTSGGLLIACARENLARLKDALAARSVAGAAVVGEVRKGKGLLVVE